MTRLKMAKLIQNAFIVLQQAKETRKPKMKLMTVNRKIKLTAKLTRTKVSKLSLTFRTYGALSVVCNRVSFEIHSGDRHSAKNFNYEKQIAQFLKSEDITGSGIILIHDHK